MKRKVVQLPKIVVIMRVVVVLYAYRRPLADLTRKAPLSKMGYMATDLVKLNIHPKSVVPKLEDK